MRKPFDQNLLPTGTLCNTYTTFQSYHIKRRLFLGSTDLVIPKEGTPGTTAEHEGLHERSFGLNGMHQIVSCPRMQHLGQSNCTQLRMLCSPSQIVIFQLLE